MSKIAVVSAPRIVNRIRANCSGAAVKKRALSCLLNTLYSTRFYVGSYARDARLRPSKAVQFLSTMAASSAGRKRRPWSTTIIVPHVACVRGSWGTLSAEGSVPRGDFAARYPPK